MRRLLYIKYLIQLGLVLHIFSYPAEWHYDYSKLNETDVLKLMAAILAYRDGNLVKFTIIWERFKLRQLKSRSDIDDIESKFYHKLKLGL